MMHWDKLLSKAYDDIVLLAKEWSEIEEYNNIAHKKNYDISNEAIKDIKAVLDKYGIETRNKTKGFNRQFAALIKPIDAWSVPSVPIRPQSNPREETIDGIKLYNRNYEYDLVKLYKWLKEQYQSGLLHQKEMEELYQLCLKYIKDKHIPLETVPIGSKVDVMDFVKYYIFDSLTEDEKEAIPDDLDGYWLREMLTK